MKQVALTTTVNGTAQAAITFIKDWVKKYSFLYVKYANWHICITNDKTYSAALDFDVSYSADSNAAAKEVIQYFTGKGMAADSTNDTGRYLYVHKKHGL